MKPLKSKLVSTKTAFTYPHAVETNHISDVIERIKFNRPLGKNHLLSRGCGHYPTLSIIASTGTNGELPTLLFGHLSLEWMRRAGIKKIPTVFLTHKPKDIQCVAEWRFLLDAKLIGDVTLKSAVREIYESSAFRFLPSSYRPLSELLDRSHATIGSWVKGGGI